MAIFATLRALGLLRRGVRALERLAASAESIETMTRDDWTRQHGKYTRPPKPTEFGQMDINETEKRFAERLEEELRDKS